MSTSQDKLATLLTERYGKSQQIPENIIATPQVEAMLSHKSVLTFLPDPLPEGALETMVAAAQSASSSSNLHQWSVVAITDRVLKQKISDTIARTVPTDHIPYLEEAPVLLLWIADLSRGAKITREKGEEPLVFDYLDSFLMASVDATLAAQNAALAAESMGLGIVFMGMIRNASREVAEIVNLPQHSFATFGMVVGKPDSSRTSSIRPRPEQAVVLHYNRYDQERYRNHIENYEKVFLDFRQAQSMKPKIWKDSVYQSATSLEYMGGREYLREMVQDWGFKLK